MPPTTQQLFDLTGKTALITGGAGYLGTAFSNALAECGARVILTSRTQARAEEAIAALPGEGHIALTLDQKSEESIKSAFSSAVELAGSVDILINNVISKFTGQQKVAGGIGKLICKLLAGYCC